MQLHNNDADNNNEHEDKDEDNGDDNGNDDNDPDADCRRKIKIFTDGSESFATAEQPII